MHTRGGLISLILIQAACAGMKTEANSSSRPSAVAVVQNQVDAYNKQDLEAFLKTYSDDVVVTSGGKVAVQGKEALRERYGKLFAKYPKNRAEIAERRLEGESAVLDHEIITGRSPDKPDPWDVGWVRYEVANGLIRKVELP